MRYIGIDYGSKRIGVAYSDEAGTIAMPLQVVPNNAQAFEVIQALIQSKGVQEIVLGESKNSSGKDNVIMKKISIFKESLEKTGVIVHFEPESFTSAHADNEGQTLDSSAAALILQRYLDRNNHGNNR